jgi:hypothetical protein
MLLQNEVAEQIELQGVILSADALTEAMQIEKVMNRAHEIHRAHGGMIGYDLEDWLQAERELFERNGPDHVQREDATRVGQLPLKEERNR